jgi:hypothetical protein
MLPRAACLVLACLLLVVPASPTMAADGLTPLPDEPGAQFLEGVAFGAVVADLDGDGSRELARLVPKADSPGVLAVDAWRVDANGSWRALGERPLARAASVNEILTERPARRNPLRPVGVAEPARFLVWNDGMRDRLLIATIAASLQPVACCLTVWEVGWDPSDGLRLEMRLSTQGNASSILSLDLDGDPADELFVTQQPDPRGPNEVPIRVYDWGGGTFSESRSSFIAPPGWEAFPSADTDGRPGGEVLISSDPIDGGGDAVLNRVWLSRGSVETESWSVRARGALASFDAGNGPRIVIVPPEIGLTLVVRWPAGGQIAYDAGASDVGRLLGVLGSGPSTRILIAAHDGGSGFRITGPHLQPVPVPPVDGAAAGLLQNGLTPYVGVVPGGLAHRPAYIAGGQLIDQPPSSGLLRPLPTTGIAALPQITPIGVAGPQESWMALFHGDIDTSRAGGELVRPLTRLPRRISVALTTAVLAPEPGVGRLDPGFRGAVAVGSAAGQQTLAIGRGPFSAMLRGPAGSTVVSAVGGVTDPAQPGAISTLDDGTLELPIAAPQDDDRFSLRISVITPAGHGYTGIWRVQVLKAPPPLVAEVPLAPFSFTVPVSGTTLPGAVVTLDDQPVSVGADGSFAAELSAGLIPRDVDLVATDAVGNVTSQVLSVVGFVDYRRLPWIPFIALLTISAALILFLKAPRPRPQPARAADDDARLEELD